MPAASHSDTLTVSVEVDAPVGAVWAVLSDGWTYASWVVGTSRITEVDPQWPQPGSRFHHSVGIWPALLSDFTAVEEFVAGHHLVLTARGWPVGEARVKITVEETSRQRSTVRMSEDAAAGPGRLVPRPARELLIRPRNTESLRRLAWLAEGRHRQPVTSR
ncbi:MAG: SRPBCC family protein [Dermatophilaceae bacterium]